MKSPSSTGRNPRRLVERSPIPAASSTHDVAEPGVESEGAFGDFARRTRPPPLARRRNIHGAGGFHPRLTIHESPCIVSRLSERRKSPRRGISHHPSSRRLPRPGEIPEGSSSVRRFRQPRQLLTLRSRGWKPKEPLEISPAGRGHHHWRGGEISLATEAFTAGSRSTTHGPAAVTPPPRCSTCRSSS